MGDADDLHMSTTRSPAKKLIMSNYVPFETVQTVPEISFDVIKRKRDIRGDNVM
jgi:hypothetical protein